MLPVVNFSVVAIPLPYIVKISMSVGIFRLGCVTLMTCIMAFASFYCIALNRNEKNIVVNGFNKIKRHVIK